MSRLVKPLSLAALLALVATLFAVPALAGARAVVTGLSSHKGAYWGGRTITVYGRNFTRVSKVMFGTKQGHGVHVVSSTRLTVRDPWHGYGTVHVRVVTPFGWSSRTSANAFTFARPTMDSRIQGGLTARQEQQASARARSAHRGVSSAPRAGHWTAAMGVTAARRASSWIGLPYSWAGGNGAGPTYGVCAHNGGDLDCHVIGFDCSGLTQNAWWPYRHLAHYAATQHTQAGRFHPSVGQLVPGDLVFFSGYIASGIGHTAVYVGGGYVVEAEESGTLVHRARLTDVIRESGVYRGATRPLSVGKQAPSPVLTGSTAQVGLAGGYVTITGRNLSTTQSVLIGGTRVYSFHERTSTRLVVTAPAHAAGTVGVSVSNSWGTAPTRSLAYVGAPSVSALAPATGPVTGGTRVTLTGNYLSTATSVLVGTTAVHYTWAPHTLTITMPAHAAGAVGVTVVSHVGRSTARNFTYVAVPPTSSAPPTSVPPTSEPPTTEPPTSEPPTTTPPATTPPTTEPPTTEPPSTTPPSTTPPATTEPPATTPPATGPASTDTGAASSPAG